MHDFDGDTYDPELDQVRLNRQMSLVFAVVKRGGWFTLGELAEETNQPEASVSARLRDLRKPRFGNYLVLRRRRGSATKGLFEYCVVGRMPKLEPKLCECKIEMATFRYKGDPCPHCGDTIG